jgi:hypothetical protein
MIAGLVFFLLVVTFSGCVEEPLPSETEKFEVHEWGVFLKGYNCNNTSVATKSPDLLYVRKPVIYFHSVENSTMISVEVHSLRNATTIPNATIENNQILWNVTVENNSIIAPDGTTYPYLFYEGEITCPSTIVANRTVSGENTTYYLKNNADYTISNVFYIYGSFGDYLITADDWIECVYFEELIPGEEKTIINTSSDNVFNSTESKNIIRDALLLNGLTLTEANELITYWESYWFTPTNYGSSERVIYTIPESVYDTFLPLQITPQPESIKRVGIFTITM